MGRSVGFLMLIIVVAIGAYIYTRQAQSITTVGGNPETTIDVTAVRNDLLAIARAEKNYFASNGKYATLDELRTNGDITVQNRLNYSYSAQTSDNGFKITADYSGPDPKAPKRLTVDETMTVTND